MRKIDRIIIHCSDSSFGSADVIRHWHADPKPRGNGWSDIGYHYVVCNGYENKSDSFEENVMNGEIQVGRPLEKSGAHARGANADSIGICMVGTTEFTEEQFISLGSLVIGMMEQFDVDEENVLGAL